MTYILITITIIIKYVNYNYKQHTKTLGFTNLSEKTSLGKKPQLFCHFSLTTFPDKTFLPDESISSNRC